MGRRTVGDCQRLSPAVGQRLLGIVQALSERPHRRRELARQFGVIKRQITSDLQVIRQGLGIEVVSTDEGYRIKTLPSLPSVTFEMVELLALLLAALAGSRSPGVPQDKLAAALERLHRALPKSLRQLTGPGQMPLPATPATQHREHILTSALRSDPPRLVPDRPVPHPPGLADVQSRPDQAAPHHPHALSAPGGVRSRRVSDGELGHV